uniref:Digestive organ expansion factor-like protein n=1 Tax=Clastoptera arizonana TaxID=38151 RepID=A0A1B6CSA7_9HEMI
MVKSKNGSNLMLKKSTFSQKNKLKRSASELIGCVARKNKVIKNIHDNLKFEQESNDNESSSENSENPSGDSNPDCSFLQLVSAVSGNKISSILSDESGSEDDDYNLIQNSSKTKNQEEDSEIECCDANESVSILDEVVLNTNDDDCDQSEDAFDVHFNLDLNDEFYNMISSETCKFEEYLKTWPTLGSLKILIPKYPESTLKEGNSIISLEEQKKFARPGAIPSIIKDVNWTKLNLKSQIRSNIIESNTKYTKLIVTEQKPLSILQKEIFSIINTYQDLYFTNRTLDNAEEIRFIYTLHSINHALKTRLKVIHHNTRLSNRLDKSSDLLDEFRDQGLTRPKVLIVVPFRDSALRIVEMMISILNLDESGNVLKKKRFMEEFTGDEISMPIKNRKPEEYERTFKGNTDDTFRIGISVTKKSLKLYADFYSADIIIASPLGLRMVIGAEGEAERDFDFLASIEVLILDQTEIFLMQNWDHLLHVMEHLHLQPKESHGTNFARVRTWALNGWSKYYRQTLVFASHLLPQISSIVNKRCFNYSGKVLVINPIISGSICQVVLQLPQVFHRFEGDSAVQCLDKRYEIFINKILPQYKEALMSHTLIYVPSYFDFIRLRNYFKKETISFTQICEYSKENKIARARDMFFHSQVHFMLYSERFHFFRRIRLKGIRHILFYQLPTFPHFYSELCNFMQDLNNKNDSGDEVNMSVSILYSKYDAQLLAAIVGSVRATRMLVSNRPVHMFVTGD